ncbi:MAG: hypothetical protein NTU81_03270 [Candidatus Nomurabacteria bacterium]|nr:hypothetical protein [Candidatus Nomurabacteria bacterium]
MNEDERKPRLQIHTGGLIILIIVILILFKVDIVSNIKSVQFQKNISYIEEQSKNIWENYILKPIKSKVVGIFIDTTNSELKKIQDNLSNNVLKTTTEKDIQNISNGNTPQ